MNMRLVSGSVLAALTVITAAPAMAVQTDVAGSRDFRELPRYPDGVVRAWRTLPIAEITLPRGSISTRADETEKTTRLQGAISHFDYVIRPAVTSLELDRHYEARLRESGYETVFACSGMTGCGSRMGPMILNDGNVAPVGFADGLFNEHIRVKIARKGATWIVLHMIQGPDRALVYQAVIEGARELE